MSHSVRVHSIVIPIFPEAATSNVGNSVGGVGNGGSAGSADRQTAGAVGVDHTLASPTTESAAGYVLSGSLFLPDMASAAEPQPGAAIIGGPGPGPLTRSNATGGKQWPLLWAQELAEAGLVALCYDQRGSGQSTGHYFDADRDALYHDAEAAVDMLAAQPEVNQNALAAIAWDEGCGFALQLAAAGKVHALVLMAPPFYTAQERFTREIRRLAASRGLSERVVQIRLSQWQRQMDSVAQQVARGEQTTTVEVGNQKTVINLARFLQNSRFDPAAVLPQVHTPVLILHGEDDRAIPPEESAELVAAKPAKRITYPEAGHFLYNDRRVMRDAVAWLQETLGVQQP